MLIDTGATYIVLPEDVLADIGAAGLPTEVEVELGDGKTVKAKAYGIAIKIEDAEASSVSLTFKGAQMGGQVGSKFPWNLRALKGLHILCENMSDL